MITVEELVVQSLYHKIVLAVVKRSPTQVPTGGRLDGLGVLITGCQRIRRAMDAQGQLPSTAGHDRAIESGTPNNSSSALSMIEGAAAADPEQDDPNSTLLDTGEVKLVRTTGSKEQGQQNGIPVMFFGGEATSSDSSQVVDTRSTPACHNEVENTSRADVMVHTSHGGCTDVVDLSQFSEFSVMHYQDLRDPDNVSMVMLQTPKSAERIDRDKEIEHVAGALAAAGEEEDTAAQAQMITASMHQLMRSEHELPGDLQGLSDELLLNDVEETPRYEITVVGNGHDDQNEKEMLDSGIWEMVQKHEKSLNSNVASLNFATPFVPVKHMDMSAIQGDAMASVPHVPDIEPVMSYRQFKIKEDVALGDGEEESMVETVCERKALPIVTSTPNVRKSKPRKGKVRPKGRGMSRSLRRSRRRLAKSPSRSVATTSSGGSPERVSVNTSTDDIQDALRSDEVKMNGHYRSTNDLLDRSFNSHISEQYSSIIRQRQLSRTPKTETTFSVDNSITTSEDETAIPVHRTSKQFQLPLSSGLNQLQRNRWSTPNSPSSQLPRTIITRGANKDILSPVSVTSEGSTLDSFADAQSVASWLPSPTIEEHPSYRHRPKSVGPVGHEPEHATFRGPFLAVPTTQRRMPGSDSSDLSEYDTCDDEAGSLTDISTTGLPFDFADHSNWMSELPKRLHSVPLSNLAIPGSHVSFAIAHEMRTDLSFSKCNLEMADFLRKLPPLAIFDNFRSVMKGVWQSWMAKQMLTVSQQLQAGVRYLDLRIIKYRCALYGEHGLYTRQLKRYLKEIQEFLTHHPKEVVIMNFSSMLSLEHRDKRALLTALFQVFGARISRRMRVTKATLEELWRVRKQVVVVFPDEDVEQLQDHIFIGLVWPASHFTHSRTQKQRSMDLLRYLDCVYDETRMEDVIHVTHAVLSPDMNQVFGDYEYKSMQELSLVETNPCLKQWLLGKNKLNVVLFDFIGQYDLPGAVIALNELKKAETDV